jgi:hypothetical protein
MLAAGAAVALGLLSAASASAAAIYENADNLVKIAKVVGSPVLASVAPIPEPATWAMMLVGIGVVGGMMRSRRKLAPAVA